MTQLSILLAKAKSQSLRIYDDMGILETSDASYGDDVAKMENRVSVAITELESNVKHLRKLASKERKKIWEAKVRNLADTCGNLRTSLEEYRAKTRHCETFQQQRDALFGDVENGVGSAQVNSYAQETNSINRSSQMVNEYTEMTQASLNSLKRQGRRLKGAHRKLFDIASSVGVSQSLLRVIERRSFWDKLLVYGGMFTTLIFIYLMYSWTR